MSYTTIQVKRTNNKTLDDSSLANIIPAYGEIVFSHTSGKDEFVIGDSSTTIPNLPRLNLQSINKFKSFDGNTLTLGDATHKGTIILNDGSNNTTTIQPSSTNNDITVTLPASTGTLALVGGDLGVATATTPTAGDSSTKVATTAFVTNAISGGTGNFMVKGVDYVTAGQLSGSTLGNNSTAEGSYNTVSGNTAHAEGSYNTVSANLAHAEGTQNTVSAACAHAEGQHNTASGGDSHVEGTYASALGKSSHAEGYHTIAHSKSQHVFGEYNIEDTAGSSAIRGTYVEIVGNGTDIPMPATRSNARTLDWDGNEWVAGTLSSGTASSMGKLILSDGSNNTTTVQPSSTSDNITITLPATGGTLATVGGTTVLPTLEPESHVTGQIYVDLTDTNAPILKVWTGSAWKPIVGVWG